MRPEARQGIAETTVFAVVLLIFAAVAAILGVWILVALSVITAGQLIFLRIAPIRGLVVSQAQLMAIGGAIMVPLLVWRGLADGWPGVAVGIVLSLVYAAWFGRVLATRGWSGA